MGHTLDSRLNNVIEVLIIDHKMLGLEGSQQPALFTKEETEAWRHLFLIKMTNRMENGGTWRNRFFLIIHQGGSVIKRALAHCQHLLLLLLLCEWAPASLARTHSIFAGLFYILTLAEGPLTTFL